MKTLCILLLSSICALAGMPPGNNYGLKYGLVGRWVLNEGSGVVSSDSSGLGNLCMLSNTPTWTKGVVGGAISLNGTSQYLVVSNCPLTFSQSANFTTSAWWYFPNLPNQRCELTPSLIFTPGAANYSADIYLSSTNTLVLNLSAAGYANLVYPITNLITINQWILVTFVNIGSTGYLYTNGSFCISGNAVPSANPNSKSSFTQGCYNYSGPAAFALGICDDFAVWNRALSAAEILQLYNGGIGSP